MVCGKCGATTSGPKCASCGSEPAYGDVPPPDDPFWTQAPATPQTPIAYAYQPPKPRRPVDGFSIAGIALGGVAVLFLPLFVGILALIMAGVGKAKGERLSTIALVIAGAGLVGGLVFSAVVYRMVA